MAKHKFKNRIVGHADVNPEDLLAHPMNFRRHPKNQLDALRGSIKELGWIKTIIVSQRSGTVLDGHARIEECIRLGISTIPVTYVELSESEEQLALAVLDPISELAFRDEEALNSLIEGIKAEDVDLATFIASLGKDAPKPKEEAPVPTLVVQDASGDGYNLIGLDNKGKAYQISIKPKAVQGIISKWQLLTSSE